MKNFLLLLVTMLGLCQSALGTDKVSSVIGYGLSISLDAGTAGQESIFFTTYDGENSFPQAENFAGSPLFGRELAPILGGRLDHFFSDWVVFKDGSPSRYGWLRLTLPVGDGDGNQVPDILEPARTGDAGFLGTGLLEWPSVSNLSVTGALTRQSGERTGSYSLRLAGISGSTTYTGSYGLTGWEGDFRYQRSSDPAGNQFHLSLVYTRPDGPSSSYNATGPFTVISPLQVRIPAFSLTGPDDVIVPVQSTTLNRVGNRYRGELVIDDGFVVTSWMDYRLHIWLVTDLNDVDGDGVPDLSDDFIQPPEIVAGPEEAHVISGSAATFSVTVTSPSPVRYQWRFNGSPLVGATASALGIPSAGPQHAGEYSVAVTNDGGTVVSAAVRLVLVLPPSIIVQPTGRIVSEGDAVELAVTVEGTEPFNYQWFLDDTLLEGAEERTLNFEQVTVSDAGDYTVRVVNVAGEVTSGVARLIVSIPPSIIGEPQDLVGPPGGDVVFRVSVGGTAPFQYQWRRDGNNLAGAIEPMLLLRNVEPDQSGEYQVAVKNIAGEIVSRAARLIVADVPVIERHPANRSVTSGSRVVFDLDVAGTPPLTYGWRKNGQPLDGVNAPELELNSVTVEDHGLYSVIVSNAAGSATSADAVLTVVQPLLSGEMTVAGFRLQLIGEAGLDYLIETSLDLVTWTRLISFSSVNGPVEFTDPAVPNQERRYYRARPAPPL